MAEKPPQTPPHGVGDVIELLPLRSQDRGASDVQDAKPKITLSESIDYLITSPAVRHQCGLHFVLMELDEETASKLAELIDKTKVSSARVSKLLESYGYDISMHTVQRHRKRFSGGGCRCAKWD